MLVSAEPENLEEELKFYRALKDEFLHEIKKKLKGKEIIRPPPEDEVKSFPKIKQRTDLRMRIAEKYEDMPNPDGETRSN